MRSDMIYAAALKLYVSDEILGIKFWNEPFRQIFRHKVYIGTAFHQCVSDNDVQYEPVSLLYKNMYLLDT